MKRKVLPDEPNAPQENGPPQFELENVAIPKYVCTKRATYIESQVAYRTTLHMQKSHIASTCRHLTMAWVGMTWRLLRWSRAAVRRGDIKF